MDRHRKPCRRRRRTFMPGLRCVPRTKPKRATERSASGSASSSAGAVTSSTRSTSTYGCVLRHTSGRNCTGGERAGGVARPAGQRPAPPPPPHLHARDVEREVVHLHLRVAAVDEAREVEELRARVDFLPEPLLHLLRRGGRAGRAGAEAAWLPPPPLLTHLLPVLEALAVPEAVQVRQDAHHLGEAVRLHAHAGIHCSGSTAPVPRRTCRMLRNSNVSISKP